jgi:hypothetical protein
MSNFRKSLIKICIWINLILVPLCLPAQNDSTGIYMNAEDFLSDRLTYSASCSNENNQIRFGEKVVKIKVDEGPEKGTHKVKTDKVFGLKTCTSIYRFQEGIGYKVINTKHIPLYSRTIMTGGDASFYDEIYFFSIKPEAEIQRLTKAALKKAYASNSEFVSYIKSRFKNDLELAVFNDQLNQYMLLYFFETSEK